MKNARSISFSNVGWFSPRVFNLCELCDLLFSLLFVHRVSFPERNTKFAVADGGEVVSCIPIRERKTKADPRHSGHYVSISLQTCGISRDAKAGPNTIVPDPFFTIDYVKNENAIARIECVLRTKPWESIVTRLPTSMG